MGYYMDDWVTIWRVRVRVRVDVRSKEKDQQQTHPTYYSESESISHIYFVNIKRNLALKCSFQKRDEMQSNLNLCDL